MHSGTFKLSTAEAVFIYHLPTFIYPVASRADRNWHLTYLWVQSNITSFTHTPLHNKYLAITFERYFGLNGKHRAPIPSPLDALGSVIKKYTDFQSIS